MARTGKYAAIVGSAFVAETVVADLMQAQMEADVPVLSAVLTPHHFHESAEHRQFFLEHFKVKGREAAEACMAVTALRERILSAA